MKKNKNKGFTILEMLVVVAVASMIISFVFVFISNAKQKNRDARREQDIKQIQNALSLYVANNGIFPQCASEVVIGGPNDTAATCGAANGVGQTLINSGVMPGIPKDPLMSTSGTCDTVGSYAYCYRAPGADPSNAYELRYALEGTTILGSKSPNWQDPIHP